VNETDLQIAGVVVFACAAAVEKVAAGRLNEKTRGVEKLRGGSASRRTVGAQTSLVREAVRPVATLSTACSSEAANERHASQ
jgi:hypothetical protein